MKKVLIIMSERTGTGHKSAAKAIQKKLNDKGYEVKQIDCFPMMGKTGEWMENVYIPLTTRFPLGWAISYKFAQTFPNMIHNSMYRRVKKELLKEIQEYNPDLIITVHSMFCKAVSKLLKKNNLNIPLYVGVVDIVNPPNVWYNEFADEVFVPTDIIKQDYIKKGFDENKIIEYGFPVRDDIKKRTEPKKIEDKVKILLVNPSVNLKKNIKFLKEVSKIENSEVTIICGRDERLFNTLKKKQEDGEISKSVNVYGFVTNMNEHLDNNHILLTKAGPNMMVEAINSLTAVVVTGHISGQENHNYEFITKNGLGIKCENPNKIYEEVNNFIKGKELDKCLDNILKFELKNGAQVIADFVSENIK